jgi:HK97 gp10 family phage protein
MVEFRMDVTGASELADDLKKAADEVKREVRTSTIRGGKTIQREARANAPRTRKVPGYPASIYSTITADTAGITEVTVESRSEFGHILEFGAGYSGPHPHFGPALDNEAGPFEDAVNDIVKRAFW